MKKKHYWSVSFFFLILLTSCSIKYEIDVDINSSINTLNVFQTKTSSCNIQSDYSITPEMILEYLNSMKGKQEKIVSLIPYPNEYSPDLFVVNFEKGFKVFPSDSRFGLVLIEDEHEHLNLFEKSHNNGFDLWIDDLAHKINKARNDSRIDVTGKESTQFWKTLKNPSLPTAEKEMLKDIKSMRATNEDMWAKIKYCNSSNTSILAERGHLLPTKWGQSNPWNIGMGETNGEKWLTGCAAVAISQVLYYFNQSLCNYPTGLYHSLSITNTNYVYSNGISFKTIALDRDNFTVYSPHWEEMPLDSLSTTSCGFNYVSDLMLDIGERLSMKYSPVLSYVSADMNGFFDISPCKLNYTWSSYSTSSMPGVINSLNQYSPVIVSATSSTGNIGHTWVIDGYRTVRVVTFEKFIWIPSGSVPSGCTVYDTKTTSELVDMYGSFTPGMIVEENHQATNAAYYKMNWGYDGDHDGNLFLVNPGELWDGVYVNKYVHFNLIPQEFNLE